ncbi:hypothetical protein GCM10027341_29650 [Spirosoma knui]
MDRKLSWVKNAFSRDTIITENDQPIGGMHRDAFSRDVEAYLYSLKIRFDVMGFLVHSVNIHDVSNGDQIVGQITFHFGKRAELRLETGELYTWKRHNVLMRQWDMIREGKTDAEDKEVVNYALTRQFFSDHGDINIEDTSSTTALVVLTGLFIRNYFQRRRRVAAGAIVAAGA